MKQPRRKKPSSAEFLSQGNEAFQAGRFFLAAEAFTKAREIDPRNPAVLFNLASAKERVGEMDEAGQLLTQSLRHRPTWFDPAQRLALLLGRYKVEKAGAFDPRGLLAAFAFKHIDHSPIAIASIDHFLANSSLGDAIGQTRNGAATEAARALVLRRTDKVLSEPLLLTALAASPNRNLDFELLLCEIRRVLLLEASAERFEDKALTGFVVALIKQCLANEYVWAASEEETQRLDAMPLDLAELIGGDPEQARILMLSLLYRTPETLIGKKFSLGECRAIRPRAVGDLLASLSAEDDRRTILAADIPALGEIKDPISKKVAAQYEAHPYPQWNSIQMPAEASARTSLQRFFPADSLRFMEQQPFKVLIAGCGTGQQAIAAAVRYGPHADVLGIDLSRASLGYARLKAEQSEIGNLRLAQSDILTAEESDERFDIIEAIGVLHHMAEPFKGWQALIRSLKPGGLMLVGLYSATARQHIAQLRSEADYPGPDCDDDAARRYRRGLIAREDGDAVALRASHDFFTLSEFRDLVLHEHERPIVLSEIEAFLDQNALTFRGFQLPGPLHAAFQQGFPDEQWPGSLNSWAKFEEKHPRIFDGMYSFWCEKAG